MASSPERIDCPVNMEEGCLNQRWAVDNQQWKLRSQVRRAEVHQPKQEGLSWFLSSPTPTRFYKRKEENVLLLGASGANLALPNL